MISRLRDIDSSNLLSSDVFDAFYTEILFVNRSISASGDIEQIVLYKHGNGLTLCHEYGDDKHHYNWESPYSPIRIYGQFQISRYFWDEARFNDFLSKVPANWVWEDVWNLSREFYNQDCLEGKY